MPEWLLTLLSDPISIAALTSILAVVFGEKLAKVIVGGVSKLLVHVKTMAPDTPPATTLVPTPSDPHAPCHPCHGDKCYQALMCLAKHADEADNLKLRDSVVALIPPFVELHFKEPKKES